MDRGNVKDKASQSWGKQMSLHDELLSHERLTANEEMRRKIQKQQSLPDNNDQVRAHHMFSRILNFIFAIHPWLKQGLLDLDGRNSQKYLHQTWADF